MKEGVTMDKRWIQFLYHFNGTRDFYACHDFLEEWWFEIGNPKNHEFVAFIQLAIGMYHFRRGKHKAGHDLLVKAKEKLLINEKSLNQYGVNLTLLFTDLDNVIAASKANQSYIDINILMKEELHAEVWQLCQENGCELFSHSNLQDDSLVNKHIHKHK